MLAAQYVISNMEIVLPINTAMLNYVDDFLCCAKSAEKLIEAEHALPAGVAAIPAGKFKLLAKSIGSFADGCEYLGHHFSETPDGNLRVTITEANETKWTNELLREREQLEGFIAKVGNHLVAREWLRTELEDFAYRQICWLRTFSEADNIDEFHEFFDIVFDVLAAKANFDAAKLLKAANQKPHQDQGYFGIS